ncbi:MAG TPA: hypothetical protein H9887_06835 [Candidatus Dorea intestinavium]|nr:hypothetical protein [Candidatus Dorea intestinavium]
MSKNTKEDFLFNNYKLFLVALVALGHFLEPNYLNHPFLYYLKWLIYSFHVPAFVFISGYFSKREKSLKQLFRSILLPYLVLEVLYFFYYTYFLHIETKLYLLYPKFSLWYLLCLFAWRFITPYFKRLPYPLILSFILGLLIGLSSIKSNFLSLPRMLVFYPFFLMGEITTREQLSSLRNKLRKKTILFSLLLCFLVVGLIAIFSGAPVKLLYGRYNYSYLGQPPFIGIIFRMIFYLLAISITLLFFCILPNKSYFFTKWGYSTMPIYIGHGFVYNYFKQQKSWLENIEDWPDISLLLFLCLFLVFLFSLPPFQLAMDYLTGKRRLISR